MKQAITGLTIVIGLTAAVSAAGAPDEQHEARAEYAQQVLEDAVDLVSWTHAPEGNIYLSKGEALVPAFRRPRIGVIVKTRGFGDEPEGAVIDAVTPGGPADEAGLKAGDVITAVDGVSLVSDTSFEDARLRAGLELVKRSHGLADGQLVNLEFLRGGVEMSAAVEARQMNSGSFPAPPALRGERLILGGDLKGLRPPKGAWTFPSAWLDMELVELNPELGEYFSADRGVLVVRAPDDASLGLEAGDVILAIGGREVRDPSHAMRILRSYEPDESLVVDIVRHGRSQTVTGTVPQSTVELFGERGWTILDDD
ncbi:MAG: PDZ domain-containing protein [Thermoanaerobaculales bacterium]|jgi:S1-C subfamily serine protease|nr:PDZ domain-containing protein [Thermoanaerobaculales bacterium]